MFQNHWVEISKFPGKLSKDFEKSIYSQNITIEFIEKLRNEIKFENIETLKYQIQLDIQKTKNILNKQILR